MFSSFYPFPKAKNRLIDDFVKTYSAQPFFIWPKWNLFNTRYLSYCSTDTHWTDFGSYVAALNLITHWGISCDIDFECFVLKHWIGDLGCKLEPPVSSRSLAFKDGLPSKIIFDNGIVNHGNIKVITNSEAKLDDTLLVFGDSFGTNMSISLSQFFAKVVYAYQPAGMDPELLELFKPDYMVLEITQRFLRGQPAVNQSVTQRACSKIADFLPSQCEKLHKHLMSQDFDNYSQLISPLLDSIQSKA